MPQLLCHLFGDYILQSDWMAINKTKAWLPALVHAFVYTLCFWPIAYGHPLAAMVIFGTHALIDRFRLARYVVWAKNFIAPKWTLGSAYKWSDCQATGYPADRPMWLTVWLLIIADNTLHLTINYLALRYL